MTKNYTKNYFNHVYHSSEETLEVKYQSMLVEGPCLNIVNHNRTILSSFTDYKLIAGNDITIEEEKIDTENAVMEDAEESKQQLLKDKLNLEELPPLVYQNAAFMKRGLVDNNSRLEIHMNNVVSCPIDLYCLSSAFVNNFTREMHNFHAKRVIFGGEKIFPSKSTTPGRLLMDKSTLLPCDGKQDYLNNFS